MKMVKSLLLGTAAGLAAMTGAQAADLPVKAKPVQYVKICSLYGAGFYYIPGTDMCLKIGGWVRQYLGYGANDTFTNGALAGNAMTFANNMGFQWKVRGYITADARNQTEYGTLRSYIAIGTSIQGTNGGQGFAGAGAAAGAGVGTGGVNVNRAFIQFAGFTFGVSQSFYDLFPTPALSYNGGMINPSSDTSDGGQTVTAYTAQFGNGLSASIAAEAPRTTTVYGPNMVFSSAYGFTGGGDQAISVRYPDFIGNVHIEGAWGAAQIMGGIHDASGLYYGATTATLAPSTATGWIIGAGIKLNAPMIGAGDYFSAQVNYTQGAAGYVDDGGTVAGPGVVNAQAANGTNYGAYNGGTGGTVGSGLITDSVYGPTGSIQLTTTWGVNAGYEHFWSRSWQTSVYGAYIATSYNATANGILCTAETAVVTGVTAGAGTCNNNWNYWDIGTRTQWNVDSSTYIGVDVIYTKLGTASAGVTGTVLGSGFQPTAVRTFANQSAFVVQARVHRNFYP